MIPNIPSNKNHVKNTNSEFKIKLSMYTLEFIILHSVQPLHISLNKNQIFQLLTSWMFQMAIVSKWKQTSETGLVLD